MGLFADFIVATTDEAMQYDGSNLSGPYVANYKGFTELELGYLLDVINGKGIDYDSFNEFEAVLIEDDGERVTTLIRDDLTDSLSVATDEQLRTWSDIWCTAEELDCAPEDLLPVLTDLRKLSELARKESKKVYLWNCM